MELSARVDKLFRDTWDNKKRSILVVLTLAIGIAAVGMIHNTVRMVKRDIFELYSTRNPAHLTIFMTPFPERLAGDVAGMRQIASAEALRSATAYTFNSKGEREEINILARPDFNKIEINQVVLDAGSHQPGLRGVLLERNSAANLGLSIGDQISIETETGEIYSLRIDGIVHDMTVTHYAMSGEFQAYLTPATLEWMGWDPGYNQINIVIDEQNPSREQVLEIGTQVRDRIIEPSGYRVTSILMRGDTNPGEYWATNQAAGMLFVLQVMSVLAVVLSAGLVVNTVSAVLLQQTRQIGIMRSLGATRRQVVVQYMAYVMVLSLVGVLLAIPLGMIGAVGLMVVASNFMNFTISALDLPPSILWLQIGLGLTLPIGAALFPVIHGTQLSVYDAIYQSGLGSGEQRKGRLERALLRIRSLSPPVMLSLRNTFRNKSRLSFTLATLTIAGATFIAVFSSYATIQRQVEELGRYIAFDASLDIPEGADRHTVEREALRIPQIKVAEGWAVTVGVITYPNGRESDRIQLFGVPADSKTILPRMVKGRWLHAGDEAGIVINEDLLSKEPDIHIGTTLSVKINGQTRDLTVVGIVSKHMSGSRIYLNYDQLTRYTGEHNRVQMVRVLANAGTFSTPDEQAVIGRDLEKRFEDAHLVEGNSRTRAEMFSAMAEAFKILLVILLLVAIILAVIGGLGLTGAMGLNVLERTREIGVLRAVGASHRSVRQVVVVEGATVAFVSWLLAALISFPIGKLLAEAVVRITFDTQSTFRYSYLSLGLWLVAVLLIGVVASLAPARDAVRLTVREVLNYE